MKAAVIYEPHTPIRVEDLDLDDPGPQEVRVKLVGGGVCRSDYHTVDGHTTPISFPWLLGHEGSGIVQQVGAAVTDLARGDHVIFSLAGQCGYCRSCVTGRPNLCETYPSYMRTGPDSRFSKDGVPYAHGLATFAQETIVRSSSLVKVPDDIPLEKVCLIGCAVMTGVGAVINRAKVETGSNVAVLGCGGVGLNVVQGARLASAAKIIAVDTSDFKLEKAGEMGATHFVNADKEDPVKRVLEISNGGVDYAFEVVGFPSIVRQAFDCTAPGGTAVMVGGASHRGRGLSPRPTAVPGPGSAGHLLRSRQTQGGLPLAPGPLYGRQTQARRDDYPVPSPGRDQRGLRGHEERRRHSLYPNFRVATDAGGGWNDQRRR